MSFGWSINLTIENWKQTNFPFTKCRDYNNIKNCYKRTKQILEIFL